MTDGGADYCFECVGMSTLVEEAYASCRKVSCYLSSLLSVNFKFNYICNVYNVIYVSQGWGKTVVLGVDKPGSQLSLTSANVLCSGKTLTGALFGGLKAKSDIPILVKRYLDKVINIWSTSY